MKKRAFIVHRWYGSPDADWYPWLKKELEKKGFQVFALEMPNPDAPEISSWVSTLSKAVGKPDENTYFVGHSVGCQTILRYLETIKGKVGGAVFVAGWFSLTPEATPSQKEVGIAKPWIERPVNFDLVKEKTENMVAIFSDDDPYVPLAENKKVFGKFCKKVIVETGKGHFDEDSEIFELPSALNAVLELAKL